MGEIKRGGAGEKGNQSARGTVGRDLSFRLKTKSGKKRDVSKLSIK